MKLAIELLSTTFHDWKEDKASRLAAALSYYTAFSLAPLLLIAIAVAGLVFGEQAARGQVFNQIEGLLGPQAAETVETAVQNSRQTGAITISAIVGLITLLWSASNVFAQLQDALNTVWEVQPKPGRGLVGMLRQRLLSMSLVLGIGFLLLVSLLLSAGLAAVGEFFQRALPGGEAFWRVVNLAISFGVITLLFAAIFKVLPDVKVAWADVWVGAAATALLFVVGKLVIGLYLGHASVGSTYGAAGSLLVLLIWVYYSAQILFFGAELTQVYARRFGSRIVPAPGAVPLTAEARAEQGMPAQAAVERVTATGQPAAAAGSRAAVPSDVADRPESHRTTGTPRAAENPGAIKQLLWIGVASSTLALASLLARRASAAIWQATLREPPPTSKV